MSTETKIKSMQFARPTNLCPFCGFLSTQILTPEDSTGGKGYQVECANCGARGPCGMARPVDAVIAWDSGDLPHLYRRPVVVKGGAQ